MPFYVQLAQDSSGNTGKRKAVVEATITTVDVEGEQRQLMTPVAPAEIVAHQPHWYVGREWGEWIETAGPARMLDDGEWETLTRWRVDDPELGRGHHEREAQAPSAR
jgi:hypothetical protein